MAATEGAPRAYTDEEKQEALELYRQHGPADASRRTGIKSATIRSWAHRNGEAGSEGAEQTRAATETARLSWAQRRAELTDETGAVAAAILDRIKVSRRSSDARALAQAFSVLIDRAQLLDGGATSRVEVSDPEDLAARVRGLRDDLAARREKAAGT